MRRGTPPPHTPLGRLWPLDSRAYGARPRRLWRLDLGAYGASSSLPVSFFRYFRPWQCVIFLGKLLKFFCYVLNFWCTTHSFIFLGRQTVLLWSFLPDIRAARRRSSHPSDVSYRFGRIGLALNFSSDILPIPLHFTESQNVRNLASFFDPARLWLRCPVRCQIFLNSMCVDNRTMSSSNLVQFCPRPFENLSLIHI